MTTGESTIGDVGSFGGSPWLRVELGNVIVVLNADTKRSAVQAYLNHCSAAGPQSPWLVIENRRGRINKVLFDPVPGPDGRLVPGALVPGWFAYTTKALAARTEL
ncbi:MAG: hypothetical protein WCI74_02630 [Actinomycetes bacterium]